MLKFSFNPSNYVTDNKTYLNPHKENWCLNKCGSSFVIHHDDDRTCIKTCTFKVFVGRSFVKMCYLN